MSHRTGCLVCGEELKYYEKPVKKACFYCNKTFNADVSCVDGHFVCDSCHSLSPDDFIEKTCRKTKETDPLKLAVLLMKN